jgi:DNA-binding transcriptional MerR regulator
MSRMDRRMRIGDVARACGVSTDTIRWYEKQGVLAPVHRERNGYRVYGAETIERVRVVRRAIAVGFSVAELARIFRQRAAGRPPCREVCARAGRAKARGARRAHRRAGRAARAARRDGRRLGRAAQSDGRGRAGASHRIDR